MWAVATAVTAALLLAEAANTPGYLDCMVCVGDGGRERLPC